ncbi:MAG: SIS domain-containing protein [Chloroflexi bacterium AL-W]|nr:SIS domain-containing protein [Chloroflexi bacterium AL-N1]NOK70220.1 SIS domain-containing protein [Chloroflexi bacterium AL-N10]NOK77757.1 SIS domain-containing protein [Chloroflexi bacterium AL-N5]NOK84766.1 SIS domain-containing protein [Chloroflexi bacterium AL-W]NOK92373.1 SIS domain-containing protein [Chloroflexi bacterium AL-N15]
MPASFQEQTDVSCAVLQSLVRETTVIEQIARLVCDTVLDGRVLLTCGNGGSATDANHLAEELVARYRANRRALPAIALTADSSVLTCISNDFGFEHVFSRQIEALARPGDVVLCFSTSGNSPNIVAALQAAKARGAATIALLGKDGGAARDMADLELIVDCQDTARIQEAHLQVLHYICEVVERAVVE